MRWNTALSLCFLFIIQKCSLSEYPYSNTFNFIFKYIISLCHYPEKKVLLKFINDCAPAYHADFLKQCSLNQTLLLHFSIFIFLWNIVWDSIRNASSIWFNTYKWFKKKKRYIMWFVFCDLWSQNTLIITFTVSMLCKTLLTHHLLACRCGETVLLPRGQFSDWYTGQATAAGCWVAIAAALPLGATALGHRTAQQHAGTPPPQETSPQGQPSLS